MTVERLVGARIVGVVRRAGRQDRDSRHQGIVQHRAGHEPQQVSGGQRFVLVRGQGRLQRLDERAAGHREDDVVLAAEVVVDGAG